MSAAAAAFEPRLAPCGRTHGGEQYVTEDHEGLVTEDLRYSCGCRSTREEFHDGSVHRMGIIACHYRAAEWGHKEIELAAHDLLQRLDAARAGTGARRDR